MTIFHAPPRFSRRLLMLTAGVFLLAATDGALARNGGGNSNGGNFSDRGAMRSSDSGRNSGANHDAMKSRESSRDHDHSDKVPGKAYSEKPKDKEKDKTPPAATVSNNPPAPGTGGTNNIHPIPSPLPVASGSGKPTGVTAPVNTIHPIASPPPRTVTISDGVNTFQIPDGAGGVSVSSSRPGTITVSNGVQTQTVSGIKITISGALGVGVPKDIQVGRPNADGSTVIMSPLGTVTGSGGVVDAGKAIGNGVVDGVAAVGKGIGDVIGFPTGFSATAAGPQ